MEYNKEIVEKYKTMFDGYKMSKMILGKINKYIKQDCEILELGSGLGFDYEILSKTYNVLGSDYSSEFINILEKKYNVPFPKVDARDININKTFDLVYSNKVLHHLNKEELKISIDSQFKILKKGGYIIATFWYGNKVEKMHGLEFNYYNEDIIKELISDFKIIEATKYKEFEDNDSMLVILKG